MQQKKQLTLAELKTKAGHFARALSTSGIPELFGASDGKAVGTYVEHAFRDFLSADYEYEEGSSASGIDFPSLGVDLKVTSSRQPQSSCPFRSADQKVYGLGYHLLVFVYDKYDDLEQEAARLEIQHAIFIDAERTADYQTTRGISEILERDGNIDDLVAFAEERMLPLDEIGRQRLAERVLQDPPKQGYLTVSNALQWRLQYGRVVDLAGEGRTEGVENVYTLIETE